MNPSYISKEGLKKLYEELAELKNVRRREVADRIQQAKELGDLSENAEYVEAKTEQGFVEGRIMEIEHIVRNASIIEEQSSSDAITVGSTLTVAADGKEATYSIVGSSEADPLSGKISNESPLGKAFLGLRKGEKVIIETPRGSSEYTILNVG